MSSLSKIKRQMEKAAKSRGPSRMPIVGDGRYGMVRFVYGSPDLVNSPKVLMPLVVTSVTPDGQVSGIAFVDPNMKATDAMGRPQKIPPAIPVAGARHDPKGGKLTWHWRDEKAVTENATAPIVVPDADTDTDPVADNVTPLDLDA